MSISIDKFGVKFEKLDGVGNDIVLDSQRGMVNLNINYNSIQDVDTLNRIIANLTLARDIIQNIQER